VHLCLASHPNGRATEDNQTEMLRLRPPRFYEAANNSSDLNWTAHRLAGDGEAVVAHQRHAIVGLPRNEVHPYCANVAVNVMGSVTNIRTGLTASEIKQPFRNKHSC
jgi:hypothetical protein